MKKRLLFVMVIMLLASAVLLSGCRDAEHQAVLGTLDQLEKNDPALTWKLSTPASQEKFGEEGVVTRTQEVNRVLGVEKINYKSLKLKKGESDGQHRVYDAKMVIQTKYGVVERPLVMRFEKSGESWLVNWDPELIVPGLKTDNQLEVKSTPAHRGAIYDRNGNVLAEDNAEGVRTYPQGVLTGPVVGYVRNATQQEVAEGKITNVPVGTAVGRTGLEQIYQEKLTGKNGVSISFSDRPNEPLVEAKPENGQDIRTTLDLRVHQAAYAQVDGNFGAVAAMNPQNGQVLALVSVPSYDPNKWVDAAMSEADYVAAVNDGRAPSEGIFAQRFTPGSTQKLYTSVIGLNEGVINFDTYFEIYGSDWQPDTSWGKYKVHRVTPINGAIGLEQALISSDNIFFARVGLGLGAERLVNGLGKLGYGQDMPGDYPVQKSQITNTGKIDPEHQTAVADTSYGQYQLQITPYQLCDTFGLLVNGGKIMVPRLLLEDKPEVWIDQVTSQANIDFINNGLRKANTITHPNIERPYAKFAGKTGTAEVGPDGSVNLGWYVGNDLDNPNCTLLVMINHVEHRNGSDFNTLLYGRIMDGLYVNGAPYDPGPGTGAAAGDDAQNKDKTAKG